MPDPNEPKAFNTIRSFLAGKELDEPLYFHYSATLRIGGENVPFEEISQRLGVEPTQRHRKGDRRKPTSTRGYPADMWSYAASVPETEPLERHIELLWTVVRPHVDYLKSL